MSNNIQFDDSRTAWISRGFEQLVREAADNNADPHYDVVIIGSGYGGAIAAATFAGRHHEGDETANVSVCVLERGKEYLPGAFPNGFTEIPAHIRMNYRKTGLFDIRLGPEVCTVVANGLGGGSLINAGVMEVPSPDVFEKHWPNELSDRANLEPYYQRAKQMLGATRNGNDNTIEDHPDGIPKKFLSIRNLSPQAMDFRPAAITVAMDDTSSSGNVALNKCIRCGDCATGCNHGAKDSLDVNLLVQAHLAGAEIYSGATVLSIRRHDNEPVWVINAVYTDSKLRARHGGTVQIHATNVVLAAGTLGSTEILKRSESDQLDFSHQLGRRCSTNGDMLITDYDTDSEVHAVADETVRPSDRAVGPTITGVVDLRKKQGVVIEEMAVPAGLRRTFAELYSTVNTLHSLNERDCSTHRDGWPEDDIYAASPDRVERSAVYAVMADDGAGGRIELQGEPDADRDGIARIRWEGLQKRPVFDEQVKVLSQLAKGTNGRILPNPAWKLLPKNLSFLLNNREGPLLTVHPLGGCAMADSAEYGVVNHLGEVFNPAASATDLHGGLIVLDGSIVPTALGTNPALTIASVALRAAESLAEKWNFAPAGEAVGGAVAGQLARPVFREVDRAHQPEPTRVELSERMVGPVTFTDAGGVERQCVVELTLRSEDKAVSELTYPRARGGVPELRVDERLIDSATDSRIRIYDAENWERITLERLSASAMEQRFSAASLYEAPLSGTLRVLQRGRSSAWNRLLRAGWAWLLNRGLRDSWQALVDGDDGPGLLTRLRGFIALATRAGELRLINYELRIGAASPGNQFELKGDRITGEKRFTYERRANPWTQLMELPLVQFPGMNGSSRRSVLELDLEFLARIGVPLFKIKGQADGATALAELASFFAYFIRLLIGIHIWSFRSPDEDKQLREPVRLPGDLPGMPPPEIHDLHLGNDVPDFSGDGNRAPVPVNIRLTRYARPNSAESPILMIHGYSASGTTFAHPSVDPNFASYFWQRNRDVWVLDMRTSSGMDTATLPWSFEQVGYRDIPAACHHIYQETGKQIDVVAHCMGAAMFSMAVLHSSEPQRAGESFLYAQARHDLKDRIRRVAFTQVGPLVVFSPINIFRGYVARYLLEFLPDHYTFRPGPNASLADDLLDRILSTIPYPEDEFDIENPPWPPWRRTPWVRTRHRMDALYGRDFNVVNLGRAVLDHIDDHFGPMSIKTVAQTIHFARYSMITNKEGRNTFISRDLLDKTWKFPAHSIHARYNGLSDVATVARMNDILSDSGRVYDYTIVGRSVNAGHQDALIGRPRTETFETVERFFADATLGRPGPIGVDMKAYPPWIGPVVTKELPQPQPQSFPRSVRIGTRPTHRVPVGVVLMRVKYDGNGFQRPDGQPIDSDYIRQNMIVFTSDTLREEGWDSFWLPETNLASPLAGNGVMVLVVYDEADRLGAFEVSETNYFRFEPITRTWSLQNVPPLDWDPILARLSEPDIPFDTIQSLADTQHILRDDSEPAKFIHLMVDAVLAVLDDTPTELVMLPDKISEARHRDVLDTPLAFGRQNANNNMAPIRFEEDVDLMHGFIPDPSPDDTAFALISCQYPAGFLDGTVAYEAYRHIAGRIGENNGITPRFTVLTGDQIYVDATAGLYDPTQKDDRYEQPYPAWLRNEHVRGVLRQVPSFMMLDDHEIDDNWEPVDPASKVNADNQEYQQRGRSGYKKYQRGVTFGASLSFTFSYGDSNFFMLDTRTERELRKASNVENCSLIHAADLPDLEAWLQQGNGPKFVVSPSMLLPRHRWSVQWNHQASAVHSDGWDGYRRTLHKVLELIAQHDAQHVVFLSGDEHRGCVAIVDITDVDTGKVTRFHSIHTQGAYTPFPFANAIEEEFVKTETFTFTTDAGKVYECSVDSACRPQQNGVTYLNPRLENGVWKLDYQFADDAVSTILI